MLRNPSKGKNGYIFFGEVLSVHSRAVEEDDREDEESENEEDVEIRRELEEKRKVHLKWCPEVSQAVEACTDKTLLCSHLIIAVGTNATGFVSAFILNSASWNRVGWLSLWNERNRGSSLMNSPPAPGEPSCMIYQQKEGGSVLICQCTCYVAEDQLFQWTEKVFACLQKRGLTVTVLSDAPIAEYKTSDYHHGSDIPFLRALKTSAYKEVVNCPFLEQPNIVTGLPAAVLCHCQIHGIPAVLYQSYSDVISADSVTMETYKLALTWTKSIKLEPPTTDILQKFTRGCDDVHGNLYT
ncbi:proteasome assembly chaperone 1 [Alosa alosa]|uniref:proteasome assembly chaperone 1 n=1 Tax=Alosa alosa TaxID=278164 RepID=UPI0020151208|nr:proteasome assembly chaperone 1 [Alosa alosa]